MNYIYIFLFNRTYHETLKKAIFALKIIQNKATFPLASQTKQGN